MADLSTYQRYVPEKELPEEIKALPKEETVCKFCGVSYLIHHEFKALESRVKELEESAEKFAESQTANEKLSELLSDSRKNLDSHKSELDRYKEWLASRDRQIVQMKVDVDRLEADVAERDQSVCLLKESYRDASNREEVLKGRLQTVSGALRGLRALHSQLKLKEWVAGVEAQVNLLQDIFPAHSSKLLTEVRRWKERADSERSLLLERLADERKKHAGLLESLQKWKMESGQKTTELEKVRRESQAERVVENAKSRDLEAANKTLQSQLRDALCELSEEKKRLKEHTILYRAERERLEGELKERGDEVRKLEGELSRTARGYQENLAQIHSEKDQLLSQLKDSNMQLKAFSVDLESAQAVRSRVEEEAMEQMSELKQCLVDQEHRWKEEVERVKSKHIESTRNLEHTLTAQHRKEIVELERQFEQKLSEQNNSHTQSLRHIKDQYKSEIEKLKGKLSSVSEGSSEECEALRQALKKEKLSGEAEMMSHIRQVRDLELKMKEMGDQEKMLLASQKTREEELRREVDEWRENVAELKGELREREECCSRAVRELEEAKAEISHLESTVQHECEERMELMEALSQAKEQLLAYRRMPSSSHSGSRPTHTHHSGSTTPRSTTPRSTTPRESIEESRQRIASMTGRSRQPPSRGR